MNYRELFDKAQRQADRASQRSIGLHMAVKEGRVKEFIAKMRAESRKEYAVLSGEEEVDAQESVKISTERTPRRTGANPEVSEVGDLETSRRRGEWGEGRAGRSSSRSLDRQDDSQVG